MKKLYSLLVVSLFSAIFVAAAPTTGLQFSGVSTSYIDCGNKSAFTPAQFTIEAWVYYQSTSGGYLISNEGWDGTNGAQGFSVRTSGAKLEFVLGSNAAWPALLSTNDIPLNTWFHLAVTYSGTEMILYINGLQDAATTITTPMVASTQNLSIGEGSMWKDRRFIGRMGDLRFWNVVRTASEISSNMSASLLGTETGLIANWKMNEGTGSTVADATGNNTLTKPADVTWFIPEVENEITVIAPVNGLVFDGSKSNSLVDLGAIAAITSPSEFTVEALVNYTSLSGGYILSSEGSPAAGEEQGFSLRLNGDKIDFTVGANGTWPQIGSPNTTLLDTWYHVATTYSAAAMKLYVNGLEVASLASPAAIGASTQHLIMGEGSMWKGRGLNGKLGYVRMWSIAKSKQEIRDNANVYVTGSEANLLAAWNNNIQNAITLADIKSTYPGAIGTDVQWYGFNVGIGSISPSRFNVYATNSGIKIQNESTSNYTVSVYNAIGSKVLTTKVNAGETIEKPTNLTRGIYILNYQNEDGLKAVKKIFIQ